MSADRYCDCRRLQARVPIAGMGHPAPRAPAQTVLADVAVSVEESVDARQSVVVEGCHHREASLAEGGEYGRRKAEPGVVNVYDVGAESSSVIDHPRCRRTVPRRLEQRSERIASVFGVIEVVVLDFVSGSSQGRTLGLDDLILPAALAIPGVN